MFNHFNLDVIFFSVFFSFGFCSICALVDDLFGFWVFLELAGLSLVPSFFCNRGPGIRGFYDSLLMYIVVSGLSSVFLVSGLLFSRLYLFVYFGFIIKFGMFPFSFWMYQVFLDSKWFFIFLLRVVMKFPVLFFCYLYQVRNIGFVYLDCALTIFMCGLFFWLFRVCWEYIWCHISLSSVSTLIVACFCADEWVCFFVYFYYFLWSCACIVFVSMISRVSDFNWGFWWYCFLLLVTPVSLPLLYKIGVCIAIFYSSFYLLFVWSIYRFSEQFFLFKLGGDYFYSRIYKSWLF